MKAWTHRALKWLGIGCAVVLVAGMAAPFLGANRYAEQIRSGLEAALGRRVEFGDVHLNLFRGPGFTVSKVVVYEDPAFGREPFAYVESMEARARLWPLLLGRLEFASLRLEDTSVNLTRVETGPATAWSFTKLLRRTKFDALPALHVRSGRINFKFGDTKSVFYIMGADLDISPPASAAGGWQVEFSGEPARTDRPARGFGSFTAAGVWSPGGKLDLNVQLERSAISEMISLIYGRDIGVHGVVTARAHLAGPLANLHINGAMNIEDVHRWDLLPQHGTGWPFEFEGRLNLPAEQLEIDSHSAAKEAPPLAVHFRVADYLSHPHWGLGLNWNRFQIEPLMQLARHLGAQLPDGLRMAGTLDGVIGYAEQGNWQGQLAFQDAAVTIPNSPPVRFEQAMLLFDGGHVRLPAAVARTTGDDLARIEASYTLATGELKLNIATDSMKVEGLQSQAALAAVPILEQVQAGIWKGALQYERAGGSSGEWSGAFQLEDATFALPGLAEPVLVHSAHTRLDGARVSVDQARVSAGNLKALVDYRYEPGAVRPHRVRISAANLDAEDLEALLLPTLRRNRGLIARALGLGRAAVPEWLHDQRVDGSVAVDTLHLAGLEVRKVRGRLIWTGTSVVLADIAGGLQNGTIRGRLTIDLRGNDPVYRLAGQMKSVEWNGGTFDAEAALDTSGTGMALLANLRSDGSFTGQSFDGAPLDQFDSVSGCYALRWAEPAPRLSFTDLRISAGDELYLGRGAMQDDGRLLIQVSNGSRQLSMSGTLARLRLDESPAP
jgi:hypothetical protein